MKNAELKKGLNLIIEGLSTIANSLDVEEPKKAEKKTEKKVEEVMNPPEEASDEAEEVEDDLTTMKYSELKKLSATMGIDAKGTREELIERVREARLNGAEEPVEEAEESAEEEDEFLTKAKEASEEYDADEIIEVLKDVGIKATKKNYIEKLAEALKADLIDLDDDEEEEEPVEEESSDEEASESEIGEYNSVFDPNGYNDPASMNKKRAKACEKLVSSVLEDIENENLSKEDIVEFLEKVCTEDELDLVEDSDDDEQVIGLYLEIKKRFIDVDGNTCDLSEPYELENETPMCCGHELKYDDKSGKYICEVCGEEYEADEE